MYNAVYCDEFGIHLNLRDLDKWIDETNERLTAVEEKVTNDVKFTFKPGRIISGDFSTEVVDKKLYDKLQAKHEADSRLISEYDLEIKKLKDQNTAQNDIVCDLYSNLCTEQKERIRCEAVIKELKSEVEESNNLEDRYRRYNAELKSKIFDLKNAENERDHYKGLYSSKCDDYDKLLEKQLKTEKELKHAEEVGDNYKSLYDTTCDNYEKLLEKQIKTEKELEKEIRVRNNYRTLYDETLKAETKSDHYKELFHSLNHKHQNVVGEIKAWKQRATTAEKKLKETEEKLNDARVLNKMREDVFNSNIKLQKTIEAKDREISLLRAELDKYASGDEDYDID